MVGGRGARSSPSSRPLLHDRALQGGGLDNLGGIGGRRQRKVLLFGYCLLRAHGGAIRTIYNTLSYLDVVGEATYIDRFLRGTTWCYCSYCSQRVLGYGIAIAAPIVR